jgi:hypothetical protein
MFRAGVIMVSIVAGDARPVKGFDVYSFTI